MEFSKVLYKVLEKFSIGKPNVVGSASDHQLLYVADYDMMEKVVFNSANLAKFRRLVKKNAHSITDIKVGSIDRWNLLTSPRYSQKKELAKLEHLKVTNIISQQEYEHMRSLLKSRLNRIEFLKARKEGRFGLLRWTPDEVWRGYKILRDKAMLSLADACQSSGITKVDAVVWFRNKYVEVSNNIMWTPSLNAKPFATEDNYKRSVYESLILYLDEHNYIKAIKRMLLLSRALNLVKDTTNILRILNGPIGRLYMITSNLETLKNFPDQISAKNKEKELDYLIDYYNHLYFNEFQGLPSVGKIPKMEEILQKNTALLMKNAKLLPIPKRYKVQE